MAVTMQVAGLEKLGASLQNLPLTMASGVKVVGPAVGYALCWEWGSARIKKPGPKTLWSTNPEGQPAILTRTAPFGFVRVNRTAYKQ